MAGIMKMSSRKRKENKRPGNSTCTGLNQLNGHSTVNVAGVVTGYELHPSVPSSSREEEEEEESCSYQLIDESGVSVRCTLVGGDSPQAPSCGDILLVRRATVIETKNQLYLVASGSDNPWWLCRKENDFRMTWNFPNLVLGPSEKSRIHQLKLWAAEEFNSDISQRPPKQFKASSDSPPSVSISSATSSAQSSTSWQTAASRPHHASPTPLPLNHIPLSPQSTHPQRSSTPRTSPTPSTQPTGPQQQPSSSHTPFPTTARSPQMCRPASQRYYDTSISNISAQVLGNRSAGVMGVLKYFKLPTASKGRDHYTALCIVDETQNTAGLPCIIFNPLKDLLPVPSSPGQVVLIKGLTISVYQGNLQGRGHEHTLVGVFPADPSKPVPHKIGEFYTLKDGERKRMKELREWAAKGQPFLVNSKLEELTISNYCSTVCLVVRVATDKDNSTVLSVYDGTSPRFIISDHQGPVTVLNQSPALHETYQDFTSTVTLAPGLQFSKIAAGDVVQLLNLCLVRSHAHHQPHPPRGTNNTDQSGEVMELVLRDIPQGRGQVNILPSDDPIVKKFKEQLPTPDRPPPPSSSAAGFSFPSYRQLSTMLNFPGGGGSLPTPLTLAQLRRAELGSMHIVDVKVMGLNRDMCETFESICQLRCAGCKTLYQTPHPQDPDFSALMSTGDVCVHCSTEDICEPNRLQYMYGFSLLVSDHTSQIEVAVSGEEGRKFFSQLRLVPANMHVDEASRACHWKVLCRLAGSTTTPFHTPNTGMGSDGPTIKLCISVYTSFSGSRRYRIINTLLCLT